VIKYLRRFVAGQALGHHQPIDEIAVRAAAVAVEMVSVEFQARRAVVMERALDGVADRRVRARQLRLPSSTW
jgi:hypothetical protein